MAIGTDGIGIDLGSCNTTIFLGDAGVALSEATCVLALKDDPSKVLAIGEDAMAMLGRAADEAGLLPPVVDGAVTDPELAALLMLALAEKASGRRKPMDKAQVAISMPQGLTKVEREALAQAAKLTGARRPALVRSPLAAALGAGLNVETARGVMVVVLGGGTTEIAVLSSGAIVAARSMRTGSFSMDDAIVRYVRRKKNLVIGLKTAEALKIDIGSALLPEAEDEDEPFEDEYAAALRRDRDGEDAEADDDETDEEAVPPVEGDTVLLKGRDAATGKPSTVQISTRDVAVALREPVRYLVDALRDALSRTPAELHGDILADGIHLSGGGALLSGLPELIAAMTGVPVVLSEHPQQDVVMGLGRVAADDALARLAAEAGSVEY